MHHFLSRPDWLEELNDDLEKRNANLILDFDDFVKVENDWACGFNPEDVADAIVAGTHKHLRAMMVTTGDGSTTVEP